MKPVSPHSETAFFLKSLSTVDFFGPDEFGEYSYGRLKTDIFEVNSSLQS